MPITENNAKAALAMRQTLQQAEALRQSMKLIDARKLCEDLLRNDPDYVGALQTLGLILADQGELRQAQMLLSHALSLDPGNQPLLIGLSTVFLQLERYEAAAETLKQALAAAPDDVGALVTLGEVYMGEKEYELAAQTLKRAVALEPESGLGLDSLGSAYSHMGHYSEAAKCLEKKALSDRPSISTLYSLSQLPRGFSTVDVGPLVSKAVRSAYSTPEDHEISRMFTEAALARNAGDYEGAWAMLVTANRRRMAQIADEAQSEEDSRTEFLKLARVTAKLPSDRPVKTKGLPVSLFIFGASRSGKTSFEALFGSLRGVKRGYENPIRERTAERTSRSSGLPTMHHIVGLPPGLDERLREIYAAELTARADGHKVFTNTHPGGIHDAYRLALTIPNVRYIFMKRDPHDIAIRVFGRNYSNGNFYSYDFTRAVAYANWYNDCIDAIARLMPHCSRVIRYEDMVEDPRAAVAVAAELCGLDEAPGKLPDIGDDRGSADKFRRYFPA